MKRCITVGLILQIVIGVQYAESFRSEITLNDVDFVIIGGGVSASVIADRLSHTSNNWTTLLLEPDSASFRAEKQRESNKNADVNIWRQELVPFRRHNKGWENIKLSAKDRKRFDHQRAVRQDAVQHNYENGSSEKNHKIRELLRDAYKQISVNLKSNESDVNFLKSEDLPQFFTHPSTFEDVNEKLRKLSSVIVTSLKINAEGVVEEVQFIQNNDRDVLFSVRATKEVILSAGTLMSPKILMLSGLGPQQHLTDMGIYSHCDLQIGGNLLDHIVVPYFFKMPCGFQLAESGQHALPPDFIALINFTLRNRTHSQIMNTCRLVNCQDTDTMELMLDNLPYEFKKQIYQELENHSILVVGIRNMKPESNGEVKLKSNSPFDSLIVENNFLKSKADIDSIIAGIRIQQRLMHSPTFHNYRITELKPRINECSNRQYDSKEFWECYVQVTASLSEDAVGTVKMGSPFDPNAVVDPCFQVYGTKNLRVIDESVIPRPRITPTYSYVGHIAERGADTIISTYT